MAPVLEELMLVVGEGVERVHRVWAEAREGGHVMGADEDVDGVDLECVEAGGELADVRDRGGFGVLGGDLGGGGGGGGAPGGGGGGGGGVAPGAPPGVSPFDWGEPPK